MEHKIIKTENYLLVVSDDEIKNGDLFYMEDANIIAKFVNVRPNNADAKKIIAHLPLNNSPILQGVDLLPPLEQEDDVEHFAQEVHYSTASDGLDANGCFNQYQGFKKGYNKAKEKYKYTEEDMIKAVLFGMQKGLNVGVVPETDNDWVRNYIQSFPQPKLPVAFKCQVEKPSSSFGAHVANFFGEKMIKTTTNEQYQTVWVGEYIY